MVVTKNTRKKKQPKKKMTANDFLEIGYDLAAEMLANAITKGSIEQIENQLLISKGVGLYLMASFIFNESIAEIDGKPTVVPSIIQASINEYNDEIRLLIDQIVKDFEQNPPEVI